MKKAITFLSLLIFVSVKAQTLTQVFNEPKPGDFEYVFTVDSSAYASGISAGPGSNVTWDLQLLKPSPASETVKYLDSASVAGSTFYPGCSFVMDRPLYYSYFRSDKAHGRTELLGLSTNTLSLHFTDPAIVIEYPVSFGSVTSDLISGEFDAGILSGFCAGTSHTSADGKGTLKLPQGRTYNNVLRVKAVLQLTLTAGIVPVGSIQQTILMFYDASNKFAMLTLSYTKMQIVGSPAQVLTEHTINALKPTDIREIGHEKNADLLLYPNPVSETLSIAISEKQQRVTNISIYDTNGSLIDGTASNTIDVRRLENGVYSARIGLADGSVFWRKFLKI